MTCSSFLSTGGGNLGSGWLLGGNCTNPSLFELRGLNRELNRELDLVGDIGIVVGRRVMLSGSKTEPSRAAASWCFQNGFDGKE